MKARRVGVNARLPEALRDRLTAEADKRDVSVSYLVGRAVEHYLDNVIRPVED